MREVTDILIQETFENYNARLQFYSQNRDFLLERDMAIKFCEELLFERLIRSCFIDRHITEGYTYSLSRFAEILTSKGLTVTWKHKRTITVLREMQFNISQGGNGLHIYNNTGQDLLTGTEEEIADFVDYFYSSFNRIHTFVCKQFEDERYRYMLAKIAQATGAAHIPEGMKCVVMPVRDEKYSVTIWHCDSIYEQEEVREEDLSDIKKVLYKMHMKDPVKK